MAELVLIQGPAGSGKSQLVAEMLEAGEVDVVVDLTRLWVALSGVERGPTGRYPVRLDDDKALPAAFAVKQLAARRALETGADTAVTTSVRNQEPRWQKLAAEALATFSTRVVDPGEEVVKERLAGPEGLSPECAKAISRWYR